MRFASIEVTGAPFQFFIWYDPSIVSSDKLENILSYKADAQTEDGLRFYEDIDYKRVLLIPETHPLFNCEIMSGLKNEFWTHPFKGIDAPSIGFSIEKMVGKYIKKVFK